MIWIAYILLAVIHLAGIIIDNAILSFASKALLMPTLAILVVKEKYPSPWKNILFFALFFSWLGDLLLTKSDDFIFFVSGIAAFLFAQISYIIHFRKESKQKLSLTFMEQKPFIVVPYVVYGIVFLALLFPKMDLSLKIPIFLYATVLLSMGAFALNRKNAVPSNSFVWVFIGSIFFIISDSLIAINKFFIEFEASRFIIMATYIIAQAMIVRGVLLHPKK